MTVITRKNKDRARDLLGQLTLEEKIGMIHGAGLFRTAGVERLGIPPLVMSDGPMGVRREFLNDRWESAYGERDRITYLPCGSAIASTWNPRVAHEVGSVLGEEARGRGKDVILAPSMNIKRSPLCGRNFEYLSEDPCLTSGLAASLVQGIQEHDVSACAKHFAANNQETDRLLVDESVSDRAMREIYLPAFEDAVRRAGTLGVMGAYNIVNGERCCESPTLLDDILRDEWGFDGVAISDWSAVFRTRESAEHGLDVEMSVGSDFDEYKFANPLIAEVREGRVPERLVDLKVFHILCVMDALHMLPGSGPRKTGSYGSFEHRGSALAAARESVVLLKNDGRLLPFDGADMRRLLVVGANADRVHSNGGGSAEIKGLYEVTPLQALCGLLGGNVTVDYVPGYRAVTESDQDESWQTRSLGDSDRGDVEVRNEGDRELLDEAVERAGDYDHVLFIGGLDHTHDLEGRDRTDMRLPYGQDELIERLLDVNPDTVVALVAGSPVEMPWADRAKAIVWSWYAGCESGTALAEVLLGLVNPSGHLPETFPRRLEDGPAHAIGTFGLKGHVDYAEDIYVGYRYYETRKVPVRFCFGHGLSYTDFEYSGFDVRRVDGDIRVRCVVANVGPREGATVVQIYFGLEGTGEDRPLRELRGYAKVDLEPGETREVVVDIPEGRALRYYSNKKGRYEFAPSARVEIGQSVQDIRLRGRIGPRRKASAEVEQA